MKKVLLSYEKYEEVLARFVDCKSPEEEWPAQIERAEAYILLTIERYIRFTTSESQEFAYQNLTYSDGILELTRVRQPKVAEGLFLRFLAEHPEHKELLELLTPGWKPGDSISLYFCHTLKPAYNLWNELRKKAEREKKRKKV